eukprot:m.329735 g.329735  ORF g.329735 m.329735 type:complete len:365 (-) comp20450_c1_seq16:1517-2611(-)
MRNRVRHLAGSTQTQRNGRSNYIDNANALQHTLVQNEWEQKKIGLITTIAVLLTVAAVFSTQVRIAPFARDPGNDREVALRAAASLGERPMLTAQEVVSVSHVRKLWDVGHVTIPGMLTPKVVSLLSPSIESTGMAIVNECARCDSPNDITDHICRGCDRTRETSMVEKSFHKARNLHRVSDVCAAVANSRYLHTIAAKLLNVSRVQLYHDALFIKESGDKESGWHQDSAATPLDTVKIVTIWIALNNIAASAGPLIFAEGSHRRFFAHSCFLSSLFAEVLSCRRQSVIFHGSQKKIRISIFGALCKPMNKDIYLDLTMAAWCQTEKPWRCAHRERLPLSRGFCCARFQMYRNFIYHVRRKRSN